jgi:hypothetical protein
LKQFRSPKERLQFYTRLFDALEHDFLDAFPEEEPIFKKGMEEELERLIKLFE